MPAVVDRSDFLRILELSQILEPGRFAEVATAPDLPGVPGEIAERLVQQGVLTRFQVKQLLAGRHRGLVLGPYRLLDQIGRGGMGVVYLAEHAALKRRVAIKVLSREHAENPKAVERFQREARAASALCHPNIMRVHHAGQLGGSHYLVMEYVDGATVEELIDRKGPFAVAEAVKVIAQAAAGLQHAHEKGMVHRDIKPENLMLTREGRLKILDLGLTKSVDNKEDNLTGVLRESVILGTIDYLSPEQAVQGTVDAKSDIYSLGATLFTVLTGLSPYEGVPTKMKLIHHGTGAVPEVRKFCPEVPERLAAVVAKMMAKKPEDRYATAVEVVEALGPWLGREGAADIALTMPSGILKVPATESKTPTETEASAETAPDLKVASRSRDMSISRADVMPDRKWPWGLIGLVTFALAAAAAAAALLVLR